MSQSAVVLHYHELWLKGGNRRFFVSKLVSNLKLALSGVSLDKIERPNDRIILRLANGAEIDEVLRCVGRVSGIAYYAVARPVERGLEGVCRAAWEEVEPLAFETFAVRAKRSDKSFPHSSSEIERVVGKHLLDSLKAAGRNVRVRLKDPDVVCRI